jgi:prefoldin subunit 5
MMTLPQILSILEKRLSALEKNKEADETMMPTTHAGAISDSLKETLDEYESRFDMLAEQINHIKDTLMKLQTFTMEVNKTLFQDKIQVVREQDSHPIHFSSLGEELKEEEEE